MFYCLYRSTGRSPNVFFATILGSPSFGRDSSQGRGIPIFGSKISDRLGSSGGQLLALRLLEQYKTCTPMLLVSTLAHTDW